MKLLSSLALAVLFSLSLGACTSTPADSHPTCTQIQERCHPVDFGPGEVHECHENAEALWSEAQCQSNLTRCQALCVPPSDAATDAATDAASDARTGG